MNVFQLVFKQMRQRALSTWLTMLSVVLGVGLATAVLIFYRGGNSLFGQTEFGFDILIGPPKGSPLQLVLNTVYQVDQSPGLLPYGVYEDLLKNRAFVRIAVPIAVGDTYKGQRIIATLPKMFGFDDDGNPLSPESTIEYRPGKRYELAQGKAFTSKRFQAVIGSEITQRTGLKLGDQFQVTHGAEVPGQKPDVHEEKWEVVGVLKPTRTAMDRVIFTPLPTHFAIGEHEQGLKEQAEERAKAGLEAPAAVEPAHDDHEHPAATTSAGHVGHDEHEHAYHMNPDGTFELEVPKNTWELSAILVRSRGGFQALSLITHYKLIDPRAVAVNPATVMRDFFDTFFKGTTLVMLLIALLVSIVASVGILVSIYNSIAARKKEIAIIRALGATRARVVTLICLEAGLIGFFGGLVGILLGHAVGAVASVYLERMLGEGINAVAVSREEMLYLVAVVILAILAGLVPALKAYRTPVATNLVAG